MLAPEAERANGHYLMRPLRCECVGTKYCELCTAIEHLGGARAEAGWFLFESAAARAVAADLLGERFGRRYFEIV